MNKDLVLFLGFVVVLIVVGIVLARRSNAKWRRLQEPPTQESPPLYWVGITRYEGSDPEAAQAAFLVLRDEAERIPGNVEWMNGSTHVRSFKVV